MILCLKNAQAHYKIINSVKIFRVEPKVMIVSSGEDEVIRIWDNEFNLLMEIKLRTISFLKETPMDQNVSAASIDLEQICEQEELKACPATLAQAWRRRHSLRNGRCRGRVAIVVC